MYYYIDKLVGIDVQARSGNNIMTSRVEDVCSRLQQRLSGPAMLELTTRLIAIPSENPPRKNYAACAARIRKELDSLGMSYETYDAPPHGNEARTNIISFAGGGEKTVYIHGHYDVVPAQSQDQQKPADQLPCR